MKRITITLLQKLINLLEPQYVAECPNNRYQEFADNLEYKGIK